MKYVFPLSKFYFKHPKVSVTELHFQMIKRHMKKVMVRSFRMLSPSLLSSFKSPEASSPTIGVGRVKKLFMPQRGAVGRRCTAPRRATIQRCDGGTSAGNAVALVKMID